MKVLLVEDEKNIVSVLERGLGASGINVTSAYDGETGMELIKVTDFDVILLDVILPKRNGWEVCKTVRTELNKDTPILMLSALNHTDHIVKGLQAGADDYMSKPFKMSELVARLQALHRRHRGFNGFSNILQFADLKMNLDTREVWRGETPVKLTAREFKLLQFLMANPKRVVSRFELLDNVWGMDFDTGTNVVDVYINYLRNKIDKDFPDKLLHTVYGMGFILKEEHEA
jgi:DNA-binding response OmpR family regulator